MNSKMDPMGRAIADYWNARSSESRQARLDGRVVTDEGKAKACDNLKAAYPDITWKEGKLLNNASKKVLEDWVKAYQ